MELKNDFRVGVDRATTWRVLTDLERIAPLLPGAQLQEVEGDEYRGIVKVKVGPIQAQYKGTATLIETDESAGKMVMKATGRDTRGQGNASATITLIMTADGDGTKVTANTDLTISGKVAQFGRGVLADVSSKLIGQFVDNLEKDLNSGGNPSGDVPEHAGSPSDPPSDASGTASGSGASGAPASGAPSGGEDDSAAKAVTNGSITPSSAASDDAFVTPTTAAAQPSGPRKIDSPEPEPVDLFDAAGNTVVKRFAPLVGGAALVVVVLVLRRRRRASRRSRAAARVTTTVSGLRGHLPSITLPDVDDVVSAGRDAGRRATKQAAKAGQQAAKAGHRAAKAGQKAAQRVR